MKKQICFSMTFLFVLCFARLVHAEVVINEIMYDVDGTDTDREWIEVYNNGTSTVDLSTWKLNEANTNHSLVSFDGGSSVSAGGYAVIASNPTKFKIDWPNYTGILFDSSFSLSNDPGEDLMLKDGSLAVHDTITYLSSVGAAGDGNTLNRSGSVFVIGTATPGVQNSNTPASNMSGSVSATIDTTSGSSGTSTASTTVKKSEPVIPKISTDIIVKTTTMVGVPIVFDSHTTGYSSELLTRGKYYWNFGNGDTKETIDYQKINYVYDASGDYVVSLEYTMNPYLTEPDATDRVIVTVLAPSIVVSSIEKDGTIILLNKGSNEIDLSGWSLHGGDAVFSFPKDTIILSGKSLLFGVKITKFFPDITEADLISPSGMIESSYPVISTTNSVSAVQSRKDTGGTLISATNTDSVSSPSITTASTTSGPYVPIDAKDISATAGNSVPADSKNTLLWPILGLALLIGAGSSTFFYLRHIRKQKTEVDEFELVE